MSDLLRSSWPRATDRQGLLAEFRDACGRLHDLVADTYFDYPVVTHPAPYGRLRPVSLPAAGSASAARYRIEHVTRFGYSSPCPEVHHVALPPTSGQHVPEGAGFRDDHRRRREG